MSCEKPQPVGYPQTEQPAIGVPVEQQTRAPEAVQSNGRTVHHHKHGSAMTLRVAALAIAVLAIMGAILTLPLGPLPFFACSTVAIVSFVFFIATLAPTSNGYARPTYTPPIGGDTTIHLALNPRTVRVPTPPRVVVVNTGGGNPFITRVGGNPFSNPPIHEAPTSRCPVFGGNQPRGRGADLGHAGTILPGQRPR